MRDGHNPYDIILGKVHEGVRIRPEYVPTRASEILWPLGRSIDNLLNGMIELTEEPCFGRFATVAVPRTIFLDLGER
ncbi:MAG: hypothetical protein M3441_27350, partial [Chloroflexota bacterium]|nr:hypothetical protein [Chloroflexota bacterium]